MSAPDAAAGRARRAGPGDLDRLATLWTDLADYHAELDPAFALRPGGSDRVRALLREGLEDPDAALFVWDAQGEVLGFCVARIRHAPPIAAEDARAEVEDVGVRPDARRRGIGRALVEAALAWVRARGVRRVEVRVASRNRPGGAFWRALGFGAFVDVLQRRL